MESEKVSKVLPGDRPSTLRRGGALLATCASALLAVSACTAAPKTSETIDRAQAAFQQVAEQTGTVGAFMLIRTADGEYLSSYGTNELEAEDPPGPDTVFRVGSNTKTWTATIILQLVDEGLIGLDDPVSDYLPGVPNGDEITIAMLLGMRSGLFNYTEDEGWEGTTFDGGPTPSSPSELLDIAFSHKPLSEPGAEYNYSNTNTVILGVIAEDLTGLTLAKLVEERIAEPLGLQKTGLPEPGDATLPTPYARGYAVVEEGGAEPEDYTDFDPSWAFAAGAGYSTAAELADFVEALTYGDLLSEETQALRMDSLEPTTGDAGPGAPEYGLGLARINGLYGHNGLIPGYNSYMGADPRLGITVIIWTNLAPDAEGQGPAGIIANAVVPILLEE